MKGKSFFLALRMGGGLFRNVVILLLLLWLWLVTGIKNVDRKLLVGGSYSGGV